jgi:acetyl-CoA carboxylase biotin carboxyl carrier protein
MPEPHRTGERTAEQREADHASLARLTEALVPALVLKLNGGGLGELEIREGDWKIRVRRSGVPGPRRQERTRIGSHGPSLAPALAPTHAPLGAAHAAAQAAAARPVTAEADVRQVPATSPAVGVFRPGAAPGTRVRAGDRVAIVDLLGIPQDVVSPIDGVVREVIAQGGDAVEYGEVVVIVAADPDEPAAGLPAATSGEG